MKFRSPYKAIIIWNALMFGWQDLPDSVPLVHRIRLSRVIYQRSMIGIGKVYLWSSEDTKHIDDSCCEQIIHQETDDELFFIFLLLGGSPPLSTANATAVSYLNSEFLCYGQE